MKKYVKIISTSQSLEELETLINRWLKGMDYPTIDKITPFDTSTQFACMIEYSLNTVQP